MSTVMHTSSYALQGGAVEMWTCAEILARRRLRRSAPFCGAPALAADSTETSNVVLIPITSELYEAVPIACPAGRSVSPHPQIYRQRQSGEIVFQLQFS